MVDEFIAAVVSGTGIALGVFVWDVSICRYTSRYEAPTLHDTPKGVQHGLGGEVLGGDEVDEVLLAFFFLDGQINRQRWRNSYLLQDIIDGGIGLLEGRGEQLRG